MIDERLYKSELYDEWIREYERLDGELHDGLYEMDLVDTGYEEDEEIFEYWETFVRHTQVELDVITKLLNDVAVMRVVVDSRDGSEDSRFGRAAVYTKEELCEKWLLYVKGLVIRSKALGGMLSEEMSIDRQRSNQTRWDLVSEWEREKDCVFIETQAIYMRLKELSRLVEDV